MPNPYFTTVNPYYSQQDTSGLSPVFQNIAQQQALQNQNLAQGTQLAQQAGQSQSSMGGLNPLAMAAMLREKKPNYDQWQTSGDMTYFGNNTNGQGAGLSPDMLATLGLGK